VTEPRPAPSAMKGRAAPRPAGLDIALALGVLAVLVALALTLPPRPFGDAPEYLLMAESWAAHSSPALRAGDVDALRRRAASSGVGVDPDDALGNYFEGRDGRFYCYHFWFYPLLTMPARLALQATGSDVLKAGSLTNAVLLAAAIAAVLLIAPAAPLARRATAALLASSPVLGFLLWPHPEVLSFSMAALALVLGMRGASGPAALSAAIASVQNPPLALLVLFEAARPALAGIPVRRSPADRLALAGAGLAVLASPLFFLAQFRTPNLAAYETAEAHAVGLGKAVGLMLDPEIGLVRYAPLTVALLLGVMLLGARGPSRRVEGALVVVLAVLMLTSSATGNWNHGTSGPSRYVVWLFPMVAYLLGLGATATRLLDGPRRPYAAVLMAAVAAQVAVAAARGGVRSPLDYLDHSTLARAVLDRWPAAYEPVEEVFRERTAHTEADLDGPFIHERDGRCRKALARWKHADTLRARCGALPEDVRGFFESRPPKEEKSRWRYVNY
jgi:hypothetical protein